MAETAEHGALLPSFGVFAAGEQAIARMAERSWPPPARDASGVANAIAMIGQIWSTNAAVGS
jgi:hypothetical protein